MTDSSQVTYDSGLETVLEERYRQNYESLSFYFPNIANLLSDYIPQKKIHFSKLADQHEDFFLDGDSLPFYCRHDPQTYMKFLSELGTQNIAKSTDPYEFCKYQIINSLQSTIKTREEKDEVTDSIGQIHLKYANQIIKKYNEGKEQSEVTLAKATVLPVLLMVGIGTGYQLDELSRHLKIKHLILLENDYDVFFASLHLYDWKAFFEKTEQNGTKISIVLNNDSDELDDDFFSIFINENTLYNIHLLSCIRHYQSTQNDELISDIKRKMSYHASYYGFFDDKIFGVSHSCFAITHGKRFVNTSKLDDGISNLPVFIIGSGPSLDNDLKFIRKYQDKALIIACGTALDILYHAGIKPDFYACTERVYEIVDTLKFIKDKSFFDDIYLMTSNVCHPKVYDFFEHSLIFNKDNENFISYLERNLNLSESCKIYNMNPLVGNMGLAGAVTLGFKKIYLFGLDNGKKQGTEAIHSASSVIYNNYKWIEESKTGATVEGNFCDTVESNPLFINSIFSMQYTLKSAGDKVCCYNCSDGAKINGALACHSEEIDGLFSGLDVINKIEVKEKLEENKTFTYNCSLDDIKGVIYKEIYNRIVDNLIDIIREKQSSKEDYIELCENISNYLLNIMNEVSLFYGSLVNSSIQHYLSFLINSLYIREDNDLSIAENLKDIIVDFLTESKEVFDKLPDYTIEDHRKFYPNGKLGRDMPHCKAPLFPARKKSYRDFDDPDTKFKKRYD